MRWIIILLMPFLFVNCSDAQSSTSKNEQKSVTEVKSLLIDVRSIGEYHQGTAGDAINIPVNELQNRIDELPKDKNTKITVFCLSGGRSSQAKSILENHGYFNVENGGTVGQMRAMLKKSDSEKAKSKT